MRRILHLFIFIFLFLFGAVVGANAQTYYPVTAITGTQVVNGITVTATNSGAFSLGSYCTGNPSNVLSGVSYLSYSFSSPVTNIRVRLADINQTEIISFTINGTHYSISPSELTAYASCTPATIPDIVSGDITNTSNPSTTAGEINIAGTINTLRLDHVPAGWGTAVYLEIAGSATPSYSFTHVNPTTCSGTDGSISIGSLTPSTSYNIGYTFNGTTQGPVSVTSDAGGVATITGLGAGTYTDFTVNGTPVTDTEYVAGTPTVTFGTNPSVCQGATSANLSFSNLYGGTSLVSSTFAYTGSAQTFTVPAGVSSIDVDAGGGGGGANAWDASTYSKGGRVQATMPVTAGQTLNIFVGGVGDNGNDNSIPALGGYNGGGNGTATGVTLYGAGGGGATDIRIGGTALTNRVLVAGGGGGSSYDCGPIIGGAGGGLTGAVGGLGCSVGGTAAGGGTQSAGGVGSTANGQPNGANGALGIGGDGGANEAGGGGGGYYGGGGGTGSNGGSAGGGGSSYTDPSFTNVVHTQGYNTGNGYLALSYIGGTPIYTYSITWSAAATTAGFTNVTNAAFPTTSPLAITVPAAAAAATYTGTLTLTSGSCSSTYPISVTVNAAPAVTTQPASQTACPGSNVTFTAAATGSNLTYQWEESVNGGTTWTPITNGGIYSGATTASLTLTGVTIGMNGYLYHVIVSGSCTPSATSNAATLNVYNTITINTQPTDQSICPGGNTTMSVSATGTGLTYQWQQSTDGGATFNNLSNTPTLTGATTNTITFTNTPYALNGYEYRVIISSPCAASVTSVVTTLTVYTLPSITTQPTNDSLCPGGNATFSVGATGSGLTYQWQESTNGGTTWNNVTNGGVYGGATTTTLTLTGVTAGMDGYEYRAVATGFCTPPATSSAATLTVYPVPVFTSIQPAVTACEGSTVTLTDNVTGTGLTYQWQESTNGGTTWNNVTNGGVYSNATTTALTLTGLTTGMSGYLYRLVATNATGCTTTSGNTSLTVNPLPVINTNPSSTAVCVGNNTSFTVSATGAGLTYQWQVSINGGTTWANVTNGGVYSGATTTTLAITGAVLTMDGYQYRVNVLTGSGCPVTSNSATLTVGTPPAITTQPSDTSVCESGNASFTVAATGYNLTYQWYVSIDNGLTFTAIPAGGVYSGVNSPTLNITGATNGMNGYLYRVDVIGTCTPPVTSNQVTLTVNPLPVVTTSPQNTTTCPGSNATFSVTATGTGLGYQWQVSTNGGTTWANVTNGGVYSGATTASLTITGATSGMNTYQYRVVITSGSGCITTTSAATLTIDVAPAINTQPQNASVCPGGNTSFTVAATGSGTLSYQWQESTNGGTTWNNITNGGVYSGATTASLTLTGVTNGMNSYQYRVIVSHTGSSCTTTSTAATLTINPVPVITTQPGNATVCQSLNTSFTVAATGTGLTYQWQVNTGSGFANVSNGGVYSGATAATLNLTNVPTSMNGYIYQVIITNATSCSLTSGTATLTVNPTPATPVVGPLAPNDTFCSESTVNLTASVAGASGGTYTWSGPASFTSTQQNPTINNIQTAQGGTYSVVYTSAAGCNSATASLPIVVKQSPGVPTLTANSPAYCVGSSVILTASATNAPSGSTWTYIGPHWPGNLTSTSTTQTITNVQLSDSGFYYVYVTSTNGCQSTSASAGTHVVVKPLPPNPTVASPTATVCQGQTYCLNASSSSLAVGYSWTGPAAFTPQPNTQQNPCINNITTAYSGTYTVYTTLNGCQSASPATIALSVTPLPATPTATSNTPCLGDTLRLIAHSTTTGAAYSWTGPATFGTQTSTLDTLKVPNVPWSDTGNYNVYSTVTVNSVTCFSASPATVHVSINPLPATPTLSSNSPVCVNQTLTITATDTPATGVSYNWSSTSPTFNQPPSPGDTYQVTAAQLSDSGNYVVYAVVNGCQSATPASIQIAVNPLPENPTAASNSPICENGVLHLTSTDATAGVNYSWSGPNGFTSTSQNPNIASTPLAGAGTYSVYAILNGCYSDQPGTTDVVVDPIPPDPTASSNSPVCSGPNNSIMLYANPGAGSPGNTNYQWYGPSFPAPNPTPDPISQQQNPVINNPTVANAGIDSVYAVIYYADGATCYSTNPGVTSVVVNPTPPPPTVSNVTLCQNSPAAPLTATGTSLTWYTVPVGGVGSPVAPVPDDSLPGTFTYYVTQTTVPGCTSDRAPLVVTVDQQSPDPTVANPTIHYCQYDQPAILTATGQNLLWYTTATGGTGSAIAPTPSTSVPGTTVYYVTQNTNGCESKRVPIAIVVNQKPQPPVVHDVSYCQGETASPLTAVGQDVQWYVTPTGGVGTPVGPTPPTTSPDTITYYVTQTINGCESDRVPQHVYIFYKPNALILDSSSWVCQHGLDTFGYYGNALPNAAYAWGLPTGATIVSGSGASGIVVRFDSAGQQKVTLTVSNGTCQSALSSVTIDVRPLPTAVVTSKHEVCEGDVVQVGLASVTPGVQNFTWNFDGGTIISQVSEGGPYNIQWNNPGVHVVSVIPYLNECGASPSAKDTVNVHAKPDARFNGLPSADICTGDTLQLSAVLPVEGYNYQWTPTQFFDQGNGTPTVSAIIDFTTYVKLHVVTEYGCEASDSALVNTVACCDMYFPTAFTPNGDGKNDYFHPLSKGNNVLKIFRIENRWGQTVFETTDQHAKWDGTFNGVPQDMNTYYWYIDYTCTSTGKEIQQRGEILLVR